MNNFDVNNPLPLICSKCTKKTIEGWAFKPLTMKNIYCDSCVCEVIQEDANKLGLSMSHTCKQPPDDAFLFKLIFGLVCFAIAIMIIGTIFN